MKRYLVLFHFGPVQEFIQTARRTDDYWAGSFMLSHTTAEVIKRLKTGTGGTEIIFPNPEGNPLAEAVMNGGPIEGDALQPSLLNRVSALVNAESAESLKKTLEGIRESVLDELAGRFSRSEKALTDAPARFAEAQVRDLFEFFFAFKEYDGLRHGESLRKVEEAMAARKNIRSFSQGLQKGHKCTQCGVREPLRQDEGDQFVLDRLRKYWSGLARRKFKYTFKINERLCGVCAGKRLLRKVHYDGAGIPSTSTISIAHWLDTQLLPAVSTSDASRFLDLLEAAGLNTRAARVPHNSANRSRFFDIDGDCFIPDSYDRFEKDAQEEEDGKGAKVTEAADFLKSRILKGCPSPPKYFTILALDGDSMGKYFRSLTRLEEHQKAGLALSRFTAQVYTMIRERYHGYVIYFGGDEGVILLPLAETILILPDFVFLIHVNKCE